MQLVPRYDFCSDLRPLMSSVARNTNDWSTAGSHLTQQKGETGHNTAGRFKPTSVGGIRRGEKGEHGEERPQARNSLPDLVIYLWCSWRGRSHAKITSLHAAVKWYAGVYLVSNNTRHKIYRGWGNTSSSCEAVELLESRNGQILSGGTRKISLAALYK